MLSKGGEGFCFGLSPHRREVGAQGTGLVPTDHKPDSSGHGRARSEGAGVGGGCA